MEQKAGILTSTTCFDVQPQSQRLLAVASNLTASKAFSALLQHGGDCALVSGINSTEIAHTSKKNSMIGNNSIFARYSVPIENSNFESIPALGNPSALSKNSILASNAEPHNNPHNNSISNLQILTASDFVHVCAALHHESFEDAVVKAEALDAAGVAGFASQALEGRKGQGLFTVGPDTTLLDAARCMLTNRVRRLPVVAGNQVVGIVTLDTIMRSVAKSIPMDNRIIGTLDIITSQLKVITGHTVLADALDLFMDHNISSLPVVDVNGRLLAVYEKLSVLVS